MLFDSSDQFVNGGGMNSIFVWLVLIVERMWKMRKHGRQFYLIFVLFDLSSFGFEFFWYVVLVWWDASYFSSSLIYVLFELMRSEWKLHEFCSILVFYLLYTQFFFFVIASYSFYPLILCEPPLGFCGNIEGLDYWTALQKLFVSGLLAS